MAPAAPRGRQQCIAAQREERHEHIANFVGTYWPVGDRAAEAFAAGFYDRLLQGDSIGDALNAARRVVREDVGSHDWANYLFYGNRDFALKENVQRTSSDLPAGAAPVHAGG